VLAVLDDVAIGVDLDASDISDGDDELDLVPTRRVLDAVVIERPPRFDRS
jgi:hypothetical protein